ncbi:MAG: hypothetical protein O3A00_03170 [Planctomycetota bacterium]|nr:hypothetical protein [Planctomycetota bacterium]
MDIFSQLTDDQFALIGCGFAFAVCGGLLSLSYHFGQVSRHQNEQPQTLSFPETAPAAASDQKKQAA